MKPRKISLHIRRGMFSKQEKKNIEDWCVDKDSIEIANLLNRSVKQVDEYIKHYKANAPKIVAKRSEVEELRRELKSSNVWPSIKIQWTDQELVYYENAFIDYRTQIKDVNAVEMKQIHQLITIDLYMMRHNNERKKVQDDIDRIEKQLEKDLKIDMDGLTEKERISLRNSIQHSQEFLLALRATSSSKTKEYKDLLDKHTDILKTLKTTRDQRIKSIEDRGRFMAILEELELASRRHNISEMVSLHELATAQEEDRLSQPHQFNDNTIDLPILSYKTVKNLGDD